MYLYALKIPKWSPKFKDQFQHFPWSLPLRPKYYFSSQFLREDGSRTLMTSPTFSGPGACQKVEVSRMLNRLGEIMHAGVNWITKPSQKEAASKLHFIVKPLGNAIHLLTHSPSDRSNPGKVAATPIRVRLVEGLTDHFPPTAGQLGSTLHNPRYVRCDESEYCSSHRT